MVLTCETCQHYKDGVCELGRKVDEGEDAYDCTRYEDVGL